MITNACIVAIIRTPTDLVHAKMDSNLMENLFIPLNQELTFVPQYVFLKRKIQNLINLIIAQTVSLIPLVIASHIFLQVKKSHFLKALSIAMRATLLQRICLKCVGVKK